MIKTFFIQYNYDHDERDYFHDRTSKIINDMKYIPISKSEMKQNIKEYFEKEYDHVDILMTNIPHP